jgi:mRNA interferase MazF
VPERGEVYWADLNPPPDEPAGSETRGRRPVLVVQHNQLNRTGRTVVIVPLTTSPQAAALPTAVSIERVPGNVLTEPCVALCHQIRAVDKRKLREFCGRLPAHVMDSVSVKLRLILNL